MESNLKLENIMKERMIPKEHTGGENWEILHGDTLRLVKAFEPAVFDAVVTTSCLQENNHGRSSLANKPALALLKTCNFYPGIFLT